MIPRISNTTNGFMLEEYKKCPLNLDYLTTSKGIDNPDILWEIDYMLGRAMADFILSKIQ